MWKLALRNILRHKGRTGMTVLAIVAGVLGLILSGGFVHDIFEQLGEVLIHSQSGHMQVSREGYFERGARSPEKYLVTDPDSVRKVIAADKRVEDVMSRLYFTGLVSNGRSDLPIVGEGVEPAHEAKLGSGMIISAGRRLEDNDSRGMMIGHGLAHALKLAPGDWATVVINTTDGAMNSQEYQIVGTFKTFSKDYDARAVRIPLSAAQDLLATPGVNTLVVALKQTQDTANVAAALSGKLSAAGLEVNTWLKLNDFYTKTVEMYDVQFGILRVIILLMVLLSVANSVNMSVFERVAEFGTMMALGNRALKVMELIVIENLFIGLIGSISGVILGIGLASVISAIGIPMPPPPNTELGYTARILIVPSVVAGAFAVGLIATVVASIFPAMRVGRIPVVDALRHST